MGDGIGGSVFFSSNNFFFVSNSNSISSHPSIFIASVFEPSLSLKSEPNFASTELRYLSWDFPWQTSMTLYKYEYDNDRQSDKVVRERGRGKTGETEGWREKTERINHMTWIFYGKCTPISFLRLMYSFLIRPALKRHEFSLTFSLSSIFGKMWDATK